MDSLCRVGPSVRLHYRVCSINPIPMEGFSSNLTEMFTSTRGCTEPMLPMCQLKVKVTIEGQISNNQILGIMSCPLCKSYTNLKIFFNLGSNVNLNKEMCRTHVTLLPAWGQGYIRRSKIDFKNSLKIHLHYCVCSINPIPIEGFSSNLAEMFTQQGDVQNPCCLCVSSRSRSHLKVKYQTIKY